MIEAKETVMKNLEQAIIAHPELPMGQAIAIEQTEISFKAGKLQGHLEEHNKAWQQGRKEVVEWLLSEGGFPWPMDEYPVRIKLWRAKLKEWGIEWLN